MTLVKEFVIMSLNYAKTLPIYKQKKNTQKLFRNLTAHFKIDKLKMQKFLQLLLILLDQRI